MVFSPPYTTREKSAKCFLGGAGMGCCERQVVGNLIQGENSCHLEPAKKAVNSEYLSLKANEVRLVGTC